MQVPFGEVVLEIWEGVEKMLGAQADVDEALAALMAPTKRLAYTVDKLCAGKCLIDPRNPSLEHVIAVLEKCDSAIQTHLQRDWFNRSFYASTYAEEFKGLCQELEKAQTGLTTALVGENTETLGEVKEGVGRISDEIKEKDTVDAERHREQLQMLRDLRAEMQELKQVGSGSEKAPDKSQSALDRLNEKEAQYMFVSADADCKGRLTREEFIQAMMKRGLDREVKLND